MEIKKKRGLGLAWRGSEGEFVAEPELMGPIDTQFLRDLRLRDEMKWFRRGRRR